MSRTSRPVAADDGAASRRSGPAWAYVQAECTLDDPVLIAAYRALSPAGRARLHDRRAAELEAMNEQSLLVGSVPYHLEHGTDPAGAGVRGLRAAQDYCVRMGFYAAAAELGYRGLALVDPAIHPDRWWSLAAGQSLALSVLSRTDEALALYDQARLHSVILTCIWRPLTRPRCSTPATTIPKNATRSGQSLAQFRHRYGIAHRRPGRTGIPERVLPEWPGPRGGESGRARRGTAPGQ